MKRTKKTLEELLAATEAPDTRMITGTFPYSVIELGVASHIIREEIMTHEHRYNATLVKGTGRCKCGAWARWDKESKGYGAPVSEHARVRLESQLRRYQDPNVPNSNFTKQKSTPVEREPETTLDVVELIGGVNDDE